MEKCCCYDNQSHFWPESSRCLRWPILLRTIPCWVSSPGPLWREQEKQNSIWRITTSKGNFKDRKKYLIHCNFRNLATQQLERTDRLKRLQESLKAKGMTDDEKQDKLKEHASKETEFLRLRRSKLGADDFEPLKVIGKGAFGEVRLVSEINH